MTIKVEANANERFALITGASSGIGRASALRLAKSGWALKICGRDDQRLSDVKNRCAETGAHSVSTFVGDLTISSNIATVVDEIMSERTTVEAVVNSAGFGSFGTLENMEESVFESMLAVNTIAPWLLAKGLLGALQRARPVSTFVIISSDADSTGFVGASAYCATKGAMLGLHRALRLELVPKGVRSVLIAPGRVDTAFNGRSVGDRRGALSSEDVAEVVEFVIDCSANSELHEVRMDSMSREGLPE